MTNENGRKLLAMLLDDYVTSCGETSATTEARTVLAEQDIVTVRRDIGDRLDRAAERNDDAGVRRVLARLAACVRLGSENVDR